MVIKVNTIIEIIGKPKDHVEATMEKVIGLIEKNEKFKYISNNLRKAEEVKELWSTFSEFEIDFPGVTELTEFCFEFMPSSIEIIEPEKITSKSLEIQNFLNDVLNKIHSYDMVLKKFLLQEMHKNKKK